MQLQQIVLLASQKAKGGGTTFGSAMTPIAGQLLTVVLEKLKTIYDLKMNRVVVPLTLQAGTNGPFPLEADYLRLYDMFYPLPTSAGGTSQGLPQFLHPLTPEQYDGEFKDPSMANYPYYWMTDTSTAAQVWSGGNPGQGTMTSAGQLFVFPQSSGQLIVTRRYMKNQPDYVNPETSALAPWFPFSQYLILETAAEMCDVTGDDRASGWHKEAYDLLRPFLIMQGDEQQAVHQIKLDPRAFHNTRNLRLTKSSPL